MASATKKETMKSLAEKVAGLTEQLKEYSKMKDKVCELEKKLHALENVEKQEEVSVLSKTKCKECPKVCNSKNDLRKHLTEAHPNEFKCTLCKERFKRKCDLELHMENHHKTEKNYECTICNKSFVLNWRMKKHEEIHTNKVTKKCHYYNNDRFCPFEKLGCKFLHEISEKCKFDRICSKPLCSYKHSNPDSEDSDTDKITDSNIEATDETVSCDYCKKKFEDIDDLIDHFGVTEHNLYEDQHAKKDLDSGPSDPF